MGETGENVAERYDISRADQDAFALRSHQRAVAAQERGPVRRPAGAGRGPGRAGAARRSRWRPTRGRGPTPRSRSWRLPPAFREGGTVTAGNASTLNDGAACVVLASEAKAGELGAEPLARVVASGVSGVDPAVMGVGPIPAIRRALDAAGLELDQIDLIEINEAFASQVLACARELGIDEERLNVNGGAIALGHPLGCSGRPADHAARLGAAPARRPVRDRRALRGRRPGGRDRDRKPGGADSLAPMAVTELASVDGRIAPDRADHDRGPGRRPLPRRRRVRGDPPLRRPPVLARRPPRPARALRGGDRAPGPAGRARARDRGAARGARRRRRPAAARGHPRRAANRADRAAGRAPGRGPPRDGHLQPDRDPQRRQVALLRRQHAGDPDREGRRRRRGAAGAPGRDRARGADLDHLLGLRAASCGRPRCSAGILDSITRRAVVELLRVAEGEYEVGDLLGAERGVPRLDRARDPADLGGRRRRARTAGRGRPRRRRRSRTRSPRRWAPGRPR